MGRCPGGVTYARKKKLRQNEREESGGPDVLSKEEKNGSTEMGTAHNRRKALNGRPRKEGERERGRSQTKARPPTTTSDGAVQESRERDGTEVERSKPT